MNTLNQIVKLNEYSGWGWGWFVWSHYRWSNQPWAMDCSCLRRWRRSLRLRTFQRPTATRVLSNGSPLTLSLGDKHYAALSCIMLPGLLFFLMVWDSLGIMRHYAASCQSTVIWECPCCLLALGTVCDHLMAGRLVLFVARRSRGAHALAGPLSYSLV